MEEKLYFPRANSNLIELEDTNLVEHEHSNLVHAPKEISFFAPHVLYISICFLILKIEEEEERISCLLPVHV